MALDFDREKKTDADWKKENGDRLEINSPILCQRDDLKISHHPYLAHLSVSAICSFRAHEVVYL